MKVFFMILVGLIVAPFFWILQKLGLVKPQPKLPPLFEALQAHLFRNGLSVVGSLPDLALTDTVEVVSFQLGFSLTTFNVVMVTRSATEELAASVEAQASSAPQFSGVRRNGVLVMACTFSPEDPALEQRFADAFMSFRPGLAGYAP